MTPLLRTCWLIAVVALGSGAAVQAIDVWTVGIDNTRQGWNRFETALTRATVPRLK
jgi:hypothetical protein